jgi:hypothetical protein
MASIAPISPIRPMVSIRPSALPFISLAPFLLARVWFARVWKP